MVEDQNINFWNTWFFVCGQRQQFICYLLKKMQTGHKAKVLGLKGVKFLFFKK